MFYSDDVYENYTLHLEKFAKLQSFNEKKKTTVNCIMSCHPGWDSNPWS